MYSPEQETTLAIAALPGTEQEDFTVSYRDALLFELVEIPPGHMAAFYRMRVYAVGRGVHYPPLERIAFAAHEEGDAERVRARIRMKWREATGAKPCP